VVVDGKGVLVCLVLGVVFFESLSVQLLTLADGRPLGLQLSCEDHAAGDKVFALLFLEGLVELLRVEAAGEEGDGVVDAADGVVEVEPVVEWVPVSSRFLEDVVNFL
jgi:hypothetical protein